MTAFFVAFIGTLFAEMGDKTQLVTLTLSTRYPPLRVLAGSLSALAAITGLAVLLGEYLANLFPQTTTLLASGAFFLLVGAWLLLKKEEAEESVETPRNRVTLQTFIMVFLAELGDKTQLTAIALTAAYGEPLAVFFGAMAGQTINHSLAAYLGSRFLSRLPDKLIKTGSALLFILFGILFIISALR
ncbi:MAG: TMEM165/GDT1 family protein [Firmicutes bacterium]|nr:TMEM165/GDT1 family protein [Bacillota bacterium]